MTDEAIDYEVKRLTELAQKHRELLPDGAIELAEIIGLKQAVILMVNFGGITLRVPLWKNKKGRKNLSMFAGFIGRKGAEKLANQYGGTELYIPKCVKILTNARNREIFNDKAALEQSGLKHPEIFCELARKYHITGRQIHKILKSQTEPITCRY